MSSYQCQNAILLFTYKRLDTTKVVLEQIKKVKPKRLYISSNHPKNANEAKLVNELREFLDSFITWDCELKKLYRTKHLSAKESISSAITWFFSNEAQGIVLEDDCLPNESFFRFCDEMLERYSNDSRIFMISGWSAWDFNKKIKNNLKEDYYFSAYNHVWGWASWRRAWELYNIEVSDFKERLYKLDNFTSKKERKIWYKIFRDYDNGLIDTWDYPWTYSMWKYQGLSIYPKDNMIKNIGFNREDATNTKGESKFAKMAVYELVFPLKHPKMIKQDRMLDSANFDIVLSPPNIIFRILRKLARIFKLYKS